MANLTAEDGGPLQIELWDPASQQRFDTEEVSTMKAHIYVLDGDFGNEEWTAEEFKAGILKPREGKGPLLRGETIIRLVKGVGFINKKMMAITDNSRRTRSGKFRLGVKVEESNSLGAGIREAISEPFRVKDSPTKKPDRPSLNDKVWRLKHIGKGGPLHRQLSDNGIKTVKDLLRLNATGSLRENFGKINNWDKIIAHGEDCEVDDYERYSYEYHGMQLVFNCIYEVVEVIFHGQQHPRSLQSLDSQEKCLVERVKRDAYSNLQYLKPIETQTHGSHQVLPERLLPAQQGPLQTWPSTSTLNINEAANNGLVVNPDPLRTILGKMPLNMSFGGMVVPEEACTNIDGNEWDEIQSYFTPNPNPNPNPNSNHNQWEQPIYSSYAYGDNGAPCSIIFNNSTLLNNSGYKPSKRKTKTVWQKIRNALKWPRASAQKFTMFKPNYPQFYPFRGDQQIRIAYSAHKKHMQLNEFCTQSQQDGDERGDRKRRLERRQDSQLSNPSGTFGSLRYLTGNDLIPSLADSFRKSLREELERQLVPRPISNQPEMSGACRFLKLVFRNELPDTIHTFSKIKARDDTPLEVVLFDIESRSIVCDEDDPLSSIKIEICVLNGEFGSDGSENWSNHEFNSKILRQRDNKGRLLKGDTVITLENGVAFIHNLSFTDNSCWIRTRQFRLGVTVVKSNLNGAINIREGISKPFIVKDSRVNKKKDPSLNDKIWHLKHISKYGKIYKQLSKNGIDTVEDLLKEHETNPSSLQEKFGKIAKRKQEEIMKQAKKAKHDETGVAEAIFDGKNYQAENNTLNSNQRNLVQTEAIKHGAPDEDLQPCVFPIVHQEENLWLMDPLKCLAFVDGNIGSDMSPLSFPRDDEAEPSNHASLPYPAFCISNKGKSKMV
ncbi:unnamed protein product [Sphenostylis stenocarpa]|uniref:Uncharacterized protein n=1 Tax=Sphenostylis stenocarpa TaxID=92480 RepID=A0AA86VVX9_9FABA|nr:unnamed protein product [Sphenostylis stenocarpa]